MKKIIIIVGCICVIAILVGVIIYAKRKPEQVLVDPVPMDFSYREVSNGIEIFDIDAKKYNYDIYIPSVIDGKKVVSVKLNNKGLISMDLRMAQHLIELDCSGNKLTELDISNSKKLKVINCKDNCIADTSVLEKWLGETGHSGEILPQNK